MSFLKQQLSAKTGASLHQLESGGFLVAEPDRSEHPQFSSSYLKKEADANLLSGRWDIKREKGWILDVQRLDGSKISVFVAEKMVMIHVKLRESNYIL